MYLALRLAAVIVLVLSGRASVHAEGRQSAFFQATGRHLVQQHAYYREPSAGPTCTTRHVPHGACVGAHGLIVWR